jgi:hypothetical protein
MDQTHILTLILGGVFSGAFLSSLMQLIIWKWNRKAAKDDRAGDSDKQIKNALRILMYDRIKYLGRRYMEQGFVTTDDLEDIVAMHKCYHDDLGGNGFLDTLMSQVKALPIRKK